MRLRDIWAVPQKIVQDVAKAVIRIFSPSDDDYPKTGVQPYEGEPGDKKTR
ncbi:MAG: hypothetical protein MUF49_19895 [Oculatellaceae cyanobacterium Prado106]|jgi:hypothetical protein|nr:hypothetical protein [Oculatellaceae cyanobacterium Prado106]